MPFLRRKYTRHNRDGCAGRSRSQCPPGRIPYHQVEGVIIPDSLKSFRRFIKEILANQARTPQAWEGFFASHIVLGVNRVSHREIKAEACHTYGVGIDVDANEVVGQQRLEVTNKRLATLDSSPTVDEPLKDLY